MPNASMAVALTTLIAVFALAPWLFARMLLKARHERSGSSTDDLEILASQLAELVDIARFINSGFEDDNYYSIRSKYAVIAKILRNHPKYSRYVDEVPSVAAAVDRALPLSLLKLEDKERLLVSVRELQGAVQILIDLRNAGCFPEMTADRSRTGATPAVVAPSGRPRRGRGYRLAAGIAAVVILGLLAGTTLLPPGSGPVGVAALVASADQGVRNAAGLLGRVRAAPAEEASGRPAGDAGGVERDDPAASRELAARSQRLAAEMEAVGQAVARRQHELGALDAVIARLRHVAEAASADETLPARLRSSAETARRAADEAEESRRTAAAAAAGAAEVRAVLDAATGEAAALRAQAAEQREALATVVTDIAATRAGLGAMRETVSEEAGKADVIRSEGEAGIRQVRDRLAALGDHVGALDRTAQDVRAALDRVAGMIDGMEETARAVAEVRDAVSRERQHLADLSAGGGEVDRSLSALKIRLAALSDSLAGAAATVSPVPARAPSPPAKADPAPTRTEAALRPDDWRLVQHALGRAGYYTGKADGSPGESTRAAIARYQRGLREEATGRLSPSQIDRLIRQRPGGPPMAAR
ncbi:peptidoglycan-binding domain-containing protein [Methylobacterium nonmethylotrophicum]|uniref:Peptidoglycan binding-like domain-containing protein n=1 Tax=Methylobacterium nonmethylotrophicum TaxID=1141884 RepID=A0A4Z0NEM2_9HYPH|nr:peptidoglycan-binding domain-containing protein [Methylobacterium nonmethylotrophicum]TGD94249.1 hypothetical protein EU555_32465 [Methylobacterium nonmethylotrophicum]